MLLLALTLSVTVSGPPLPPEQAVAVLRASRSIADRTNVVTLDPERPVWITVFRPEPAKPIAPPVLYNQPLVFRLPRAVGYPHRVRQPITDQGRAR